MSQCAAEECAMQGLEEYTQEDMVMLTKVLEKKKPVGDMIESYNYWVQYMLQRQLNASAIKYRISENTTHTLTFKIGAILGPLHDHQGLSSPLYAHEAIKSKLSMVAQVFVSPSIVVQDTVNADKGGNVDIARVTSHVLETEGLLPFFEIPVMKGSILDRAKMGQLSKEQLLNRGENPRDPGGYFIYRGTRSSIPSVEKLRINQVHVMASCKKFAYRHARQTISVPTGTALMKICYMHKKGNCGFTTSMLGSPTPSEVTSSKDDFIVKEFRYVGVFHMLKFLAHASKQDGPFKTRPVDYCVDLILNMTPDKYRNNMRVALGPSLIELNSKSSDDVLLALISWLNMMEKTSIRKQGSCFHVFREYVVNQVFYSSTTMLEKAHAICYMTWRLLSNVCGIPGHNFTSMNDWGNKRLDVSSVSFSQIFRTAYHGVMQSVEKSFDKGESTQDSTVITSILGKKQTITDNLMAPFKGNTGKKDTVRKAFELAQTVKFHNMIDLYCALTKINVKVDKGTKDRAVRAVQETQISKVCLVDTPDDDGCGIIKHLSIGSYVTSGSEMQMHLCRVLDRTGLIKKERTEELACPVQVNFNPLFGWCEGIQTYLRLIVLRRGSPAQCSDVGIEERGVVLHPSLDISISYQACIDNIRTYWNDYLTDDTQGYVLWIEGERTEYSVNEKFAKDYMEWCSLLLLIDKNVCISLSKLNSLEIYSDMGRITRPVYVSDKFDGVHETLIERYKARDLSIDDLEKYGFIDYIDAYEENSNYVVTPHSSGQMRMLDEESKAFRDKVKYLEQEENRTVVQEEQLEHYKSLLRNRKWQSIRYVGIHGITLFGASTGTSPYVNHNPFSRNTFASKTRKQTLTSPYIYTEHKDSKYTLSSTVPLVDNTKLSSIYGLSTFTQGNPAVLGMYTDEFNQEDALVVSSSYAADKMYVTTYTYEVEVATGNPQTIEELIHPRKIPGMEYGNKDRYRFICDNGLPMIGAKLKEGDMVISVCSRPRSSTGGAKGTEFSTSSSVSVRKEEKGVVVSIVSRPVIGIGSGRVSTSITRYSVLLERRRTLKNGDKMSTGQGQKATIYIVPHYDMPFDEYGTVVDILMNSHALPTRLTASLILEMIIGKAGALRGQMFGGTSFEKPPREEAEKILQQHGYVIQGYGTLKTGTTGTTFRTGVYVGVVQMQELVHKAQDKRQARGVTGKFDTISRQPKKGRPEGAARTGEQERDAIIAHGALLFALERFKTLSDNHVQYICTACCKKVFNPATPACPYCMAEKSVVYVNTTFAYNVIAGFLLGVNIELRSDVKSLVDIVSELNAKDLEQQSMSDGDDTENDEGDVSEEDDLDVPNYDDDETY